MPEDGSIGNIGRIKIGKRPYFPEYTGKWATTKDLILAHLASEDLYKFAYIGHGAAGCLTGISDPEKESDPKNWDAGIMAGDKYTKYGIAELHLIACQTNQSAWQWRKNVSSLGRLRTVTGIMGFLQAVFGHPFVDEHGK